MYRFTAGLVSQGLTVELDGDGLTIAEIMTTKSSLSLDCTREITRATPYMGVVFSYKLLSSERKRWYFRHHKNPVLPNLILIDSNSIEIITFNM